MKTGHNKFLQSCDVRHSPIQVLGVSMKLSVLLQLLDLGQSVGTQTEKNAHTTQTLNIHAQSGIRTDGLGVRASETVHALDRSATVTGKFRITTS
jgi:hypothetical protein